MAQVGCPDRRIDRLCITCCSPSQPSHHAMVLGAISSDPQRGWIIISLAPSHHCPGHSGELVGKRDGGDFGRPSCQQRCDPGPILGAVDLGIANDGESIVVIVCMTWLLQIVGALTAPTSMALTCRWRSRPQHHERTHALQQMFCSRLDGYSITSSAVASSTAGTSRPSALAVFRLMTNSNLVGRTTGKSLALSPLRMRPP